MSIAGYILYVDDEPSNLVVFESALRSELPVLTANTGAEALELMEQHDVAVLLTDQRMPGMSGVELMEQVQNQYPETVRMLVTAYSDVEAAIDAINRGRVHLYLRKPWEPVALKLALVQARERYLGKRRLDELERRLVETERLYALGVVAAGVAHEIRSPLTALSMNLELLQGLLGRRAVGEPELAGARTALADAGEAVQSIIDITNSIELTTRSRADSEVDLREVAELASRSVRGEARRRGRLELDLAVVPAVTGSRTRLGQVVLNLLVNALEALDPARAHANLVRLRLRPAREAVELEVQDNGSGIDAATLKRIFDPFFTTKKNGGTGLGLAISRQIVSELGGSLEAWSEPGEGTRFTVRLPVRRDVSE